jgi:hypothetical protein
LPAYSEVIAEEGKYRHPRVEKHDCLVTFDCLAGGLVQLIQMSSGGDWVYRREGNKVFVNLILEASPILVIWTTKVIGNVDAAILRQTSFVLRLDLPSRATVPAETASTRCPSRTDEEGGSMDGLFKDRVRERDLDNFLVEELHASQHFRDWLIAHISAAFAPPTDCEVRMHKSPPREQDARQTDVRMGWFDVDGEMTACVLIESKVTEGFQPGQAEAYAYERTALRSRLGALNAASLLVAPVAKLSSLAHDGAFDADIAIESVIDFLAERRAAGLPSELDARLAAKIDLLEALCGKRASSEWLPVTVPVKRDFAQAYAALARELIPKLSVRRSIDGHKSFTRTFDGFAPPDLPKPQLRHEFGNNVDWKYVNAQFGKLAHRVADVEQSGLTAGTPYEVVAAEGSLAVRVKTPGIDSTRSFEDERPAVETGLMAVRDLVVWLEANASRLAALLDSTPAAANPKGTGTARDMATTEREFDALLRQVYTECDKLGYRPTGMLGMIADHGAIGTAKRLLELPSSDGFARLVLLGRRDLAIESIVLDPRWDGVFTDQERKIAKRRLR